MVVLKKIKSATLVEALVATILIVVIFVVSSLVINNLLLNNFSNNTHQIETRMSELEYNLINKQIEIPYTEQYNDWDIEIEKKVIDRTNWIELTASKKNSKKSIMKKIIYE